MGVSRNRKVPGSSPGAGISIKMAKKHKKKVLISKKKEDKKKILELGFTFLIAISLVLSLIGFLYNDNNSSRKINGYKVGVTDHNSYILSNKKGSIEIYTNPYFLLDINTTKELSILNISFPFILSFDPEMDSLYLQYLDPERFLLTQNAVKNNQIVINAVISNTTKYDLPVINCYNSTKDIKVIEIRQGERNLSKIYPTIINSNDCRIVLINNPKQIPIVIDYLSLQLIKNE